MTRVKRALEIGRKHEGILVQNLLSSLSRKGMHWLIRDSDSPVHAHGHLHAHAHCSSPLRTSDLWEFADEQTPEQTKDEEDDVDMESDAS